MAILIIIFLAISTIFYVLVIDYNDNNNNISIDTQPPVIQNITGSFFVNVGDTATIFIDFFDNRGVVEAKLFYKKSSDKNWSSKNILEGSADIKIPLNSDESWYYYVIINDKSGNGPVGEPSIDGSKFYTITVIDDKKDISHKVFIEEGTASWCSSCPDTAKIIQNIFDFDNPSFYYINLVQDKSNSGKLWNYAIVHARNPERAQLYANKLEKVLGKEPYYIMSISPVVGVHNGPGACAVGLLVEKE